MSKDADLRYPIGKFRAALPATPESREAGINVIADLPVRIRAATSGLSNPQLDTAYRPGGWTVRQVVHHVADSHMNAFIRVKLALTEDRPTIKPYDESAWARLPDMLLPIAPSLELLDALHARWTTLLRGMAADDFSRSFHHPELGSDMTLDALVQMYAWHSRHHVAHITELRRREGW